MSQKEINLAVEILRRGGLVAIPTETVYGLGADATNRSAIQKIYQLKGRPSTNPLIVHVASIEIAKRYAVSWDSRAEQLARVFWPGPITIVLPKNPAIVDDATAGLASVGIRVPDHPLTLDLLDRFDGPLAAPSANKSTHVSPTTAEHVRFEFGESVDLILDGGPCRVGIESTVIDLSADTPVILRPGHISREQIEKLIGAVRVFEGKTSFDSPALSPGQHEKHYAPRNPAYRFTPDQWDQIPLEKCRVLSLTRPGDAMFITMSSDPDEYARHFYGVLRLADRAGVPIYVEMPPDLPPWAAIRDRISRATKPL